MTDLTEAINPEKWELTMNNEEQREESREQVYRLCHKLLTLRPPIDLRSKKADETLRFWLPEISWEDIERYKKEFIAEGGTKQVMPEQHS